MLFLFCYWFSFLRVHSSLYKFILILRSNGETVNFHKEFKPKDRKMYLEFAAVDFIIALTKY